jgi:hypothetical protein
VQKSRGGIGDLRIEPPRTRTAAEDHKGVSIFAMDQ